LVSTMDHGVELGKIPNIFLGNYWTVQSSLGKEPVLPLISVPAKDEIKLEGLAVFHGSRMVATLNPLEVAGFLELTGAHAGGYAFALPVPGDPKHSITVKALTRRTRIKMRLEHGRPVADVYCRLDTRVEERTGTVSLNSHYADIARQLEQNTTQLQQRVIRKLQGLNCDCVGFGELLRAAQPAYFKQFTTRDQWDEAFTHMPVRIHVQAVVRRAGMSAR
ncbi:MAG: Ger(x)C family spore germination C-terminal domain-containing protein, partial [Alicyclobacillus sp.]|nr:Ger(x)C family spore germination C-terminal domain-containing protein [Alicyclobacillus sp.]